MNGDDALDGVDPEDRKLEFKKKISYDDDDNVYLPEKYSMGSIGLQFGVRYMLK